MSVILPRLMHAVLTAQECGICLSTGSSSSDIGMLINDQTLRVAGLITLGALCSSSNEVLAKKKVFIPVFADLKSTQGDLR